MSINQVTVIGNCGKIESKDTRSGTVTNLSIAVNEKWKDKNGESQERTEWVRCTAFGGTAKLLNDRVSKGSQVGVQGGLRTRKWEDKQGQTQYTTEVMVQRVIAMPDKSSARPTNELDQALLASPDDGDDFPF